MEGGGLGRENLIENGGRGRGREQRPEGNILRPLYIFWLHPACLNIHPGRVVWKEGEEENGEVSLHLLADCFTASLPKGSHQKKKD